MKEKVKGEWEERKEKTGKLTFRASLFRTAASRMPLMSSTAKPTYRPRHMYTYYQSHDYHVIINHYQHLRLFTNSSFAITLQHIGIRATV